MAEFFIEKPYISIGGNVLSSEVRSITVNASKVEIDSTSGGDSAFSRIKGLGDWRIDITFKQDFDAAAVDAVLWDELEAATNTVEFRPSTDSVGADNPSFSGTGILTDYTIMQGSIGDLAESPVSISCANGSMLTRATS